MATPYTDLTEEEKEAIRPILRPASGSLPFGDPGHVFNTLLYVLWEFKLIRGSHGTGYSHSSKLSEAIQHWWDEPDKLEEAWRAYLKLQSDEMIEEWGEIFDLYANSWQHRDEAQRYASRVHSLWFHTMLNVLRLERPRRRRQTAKK